MVILIFCLLAFFHSALQQRLHQLPSKPHISLESFSNGPKMSPLSIPLQFFLPDQLIIVSKIRQDHSQRPVDLVKLDFSQRSRLLMRVEKIDEIDDLQHHMCNLEIIKNHIIVHHLSKSTMMIIKNKVIFISFHFLFRTHICRNVLGCPLSILHSYPIEPNQISAGIGLQLFNVKEEGVDLWDWDLGVSMHHIGTIIETGPVNTIASMLCPCW